MNPRISIVLPVYNGQHYLKECIASVLSQNHSDFELLISDDASTDNSMEIISGFRDSRIRHFSYNQNRGLFLNLNALISSTRAPLVRLLGQDDILEPDCLTTEIHFFSDHPTIGMSFSKPIVIDALGNELDRAVLGDLPEIVVPSISLQYFYYYGCLPSSISTVCIRKSVLEKLGPFQESFVVAGDYEMWTRICQHWDLGVIHRRLVRVRLHRAQLSSANSSRVPFVSENRRVRASIFPFLPAQDRSWARIYTKMRQNVFDAHCTVQLAIAGQFRQVLQIMQIMGLGEFGVSLMFWLLTGNNRLYRPGARIRAM